MTTISILPEASGPASKNSCAVAKEWQSVSSTVGEALDALRAKLDQPESTTLVVVQSLRPDAFFTAQQQQRLQELMTRWRVARDAGSTLPPEEQAELDALVQAEVCAAKERAAALVHGIPP